MALLPLSQRLDQFKKLASDVEQGSKKAKTFKTGTRRLARFVRRISDLIAMYCELGEWIMNREKESLEVLYDAVEEAKDLVSSCSRHYSVIGSLRAKELQDRFSQWGESVAEALVEFADGEEFGEVELQVEFQTEINALTEHLSGALFVDREMKIQCEFAQSLLDALKSLSQSPSYSTITGLIDAVINDRSFDLEDLSAIGELYASKPEWLESTGLKEEYLAFLHMIITKAMSKKQGFQSLVKDPVPEVPASFKCLISNQIMRDPVLATGHLFHDPTGHIYDRESITGRLRTGNHTCPVTGKSLFHVRLISLPTLKKDIDDFVTKHGLSRPPTNSPQNAPVEASGVVTSGVFGPSGGGPATGSVFGPAPVGSTPGSVFGPAPGGLFPTPSGFPGAVFQSTTFPMSAPPSNWQTTPPMTNVPPPQTRQEPTSVAQECFMSIVTEKEFQHLDLEQLRHHDYAQRGYNGLNMEALQSQINQLSVDEHSKNFSNGVQFPPRPASVPAPSQFAESLMRGAITFGAQTPGVNPFGQGFGVNQASAFAQPGSGASAQFAASPRPPSSAPQ